MTSEEGMSFDVQRVEMNRVAENIVVERDGGGTEVRIADEELSLSGEAVLATLDAVEAGAETVDFGGGQPSIAHDGEHGEHGTLVTWTQPKRQKVGISADQLRHAIRRVRPD